MRASPGWSAQRCLLLFTYVFLANAWMGDDAYITFRSVWNFVHGYGLTFNPDERVQAYTHPLWMLVVSAAHFVTREFFFTVDRRSRGRSASPPWRCSCAGHARCLARRCSSRGCSARRRSSTTRRRASSIR